MEKSKSKSNSERMSAKDAFINLGLPQGATTEEINKSFKEKLSDLEKKYSDKPDELVQRADYLYNAYRVAYLSKENANEDDMLPLTITGPDAMLNIFGINEVPHQSLKVKMQSQAHYKDGQLLKTQSTKTESFINKDGKRETKVFENGKLIKHTIGDKDVVLKKK